jgi:hypothetical protein
VVEHLDNVVPIAQGMENSHQIVKRAIAFQAKVWTFTKADTIDPGPRRPPAMFSRDSHNGNSMAPLGKLNRQPHNPIEGTKKSVVVV